MKLEIKNYGGWQYRLKGKPNEEVLVKVGDKVKIRKLSRGGDFGTSLIKTDANTKVKAMYLKDVKFPD